MTIETLRGVLLWSAIINYALLVFWALLALFARGPMHRIGRMVGLSDETFDAIQYGGIVLYKLAIFLFFLIPYVALRIVT